VSYERSSKIIRRILRMIHEALEQEAHRFSCGRNANNVMIFVMVQI
jgi:hypothetical protein